MSDIVERLRKAVADYDDVGWSDTVLEAAAEIERLRAKLAMLEQRQAKPQQTR
jgi:phage tail tape-measure protein